MEEKVEVVETVKGIKIVLPMKMFWLGIITGFSIGIAASLLLTIFIGIVTV